MSNKQTSMILTPSTTSTKPKPSLLSTTRLIEVKEQPKVNAFLQRIERNSEGSRDTYLVGLAWFQEFLNLRNKKVVSHDNITKKYTLENIIKPLSLNKINVYELLDEFVNFLGKKNQPRKISVNTIKIYLSSVKSYLESQDIEINPFKFRRKVTIPKNHREDEEPMDVSDIRKILLSCNNRRLKAYLLVLASGGLRAVEALAIRLKDLDFTNKPTKVHVRKEFTKTKVSRDVYISDEATYYLKQLIEWKYRIHKDIPSRTKVRTDDDLVFSIRRQNKTNPKNIYYKIETEFNKLLATVQLDQRKENMLRRKITFHSFRRFAKTVIANQTNTDYSEWFLGHSKSPYYTMKEPDRRDVYLSKCMRYLTFLDYTGLEAQGKGIESKLQEKDIEIRALLQREQSMQTQLNSVQSMLSSLIQGLQNTTDQKSFDAVARSLLSSGMLKVARKRTKEMTNKHRP